MLRYQTTLQSQVSENWNYFRWNRNMKDTEIWALPLYFPSRISSSCYSYRQLRTTYIEDSLSLCLVRWEVMRPESSIREESQKDKSKGASIILLLSWVYFSKLSLRKNFWYEINEISYESISSSAIQREIYWQYKVYYTIKSRRTINITPSIEINLERRGRDGISWVSNTDLICDLRFSVSECDVRSKDQTVYSWHLKLSAVSLGAWLGSVLWVAH